MMKSANGTRVTQASKKAFSNKFPLWATNRERQHLPSSLGEEFMEQPQSFQAAASSLPPGCRFFPSDEQLLCFYLSNKTAATISPNSLGNGASAGFNLIKELDPFAYDPFNLPDFACFSYGSSGTKKHWYYYTVRVFRENRGRIRMKGGYWRRKGRVREVIGHRGVALGFKRSFVFYSGNSIKNAVKTNCIMHEYALGDHLKASFVLHRVFVNGRGNSISSNGLSFYGDGSVSAVCHNGNQQDGIQVTTMIDTEPHEEDALNTTNDITRHEMGHSEKPHYLGVTDPVSAPTTFQVPSEAYPCEMMTPSPVTPDGSMSTHVIDKQQLISILEGDFLELDDLID